MGKTTVSKNLKKLLNLRGVSQTDMARTLEINESTVSSWVNGNKYPRRDKIELMADYFRVMPSDITDDKIEDNKVTTIPVSTVPVLSKVSAGMPIYAEENIVEYIYLPANEVRPGKDVFGLIVSGDSMNKEFKEGDIVIIEKDSIVENGEIGVVMINGYSATLKQIKYVNDSIVLFPLSDNPAHDPQIYNDQDEVCIIGKVIGMHRKF